MKNTVLNNTLISIIIPVYNAEQYLSQNIEAVLQQTYKEFEVIYVLDGCTDNSRHILKKYADTDSRIKLIERDYNLGAAKTRNEGLALAHGEWVIFWDADDEVCADALENMITFGMQYNADLVVCGYNNVEHTHDLDCEYSYNQIKEKCADFPLYFHNKSKENLHELILCNAPFNKMIKRSVLKKNGIEFQELQNCNDLFFSIAIFVVSQRIVYIPKALYLYRENSKGCLTVGRLNKKSYILDALEAVRRLLCSYNYDETIFKQLALIEILGHRGTNCYSEILEEFNQNYSSSWDISFENKYLYSFPKSQEICHQRIVIFGAGQVGRDYYSLLKNNTKIVGIIDKKADGKTVRIVDEVMSMDFDVIVIAVDSIDVAKTMEHKLLELNIPPSKIIWCKPQML